MRTIVVGLLLLGAAAAVGQTSTQTVDSDEQAVREVIVNFGEAWNRHDADAILALFTDDADWINVAGNWWHGRAEHQRETAWVHEHVFKNARGHTGHVALRFPTPNTAVAILTHEVDSFVLPDGTRNPGGNHRLSFFLVKHQGRWLITSGQNTEIKPGVRDPAKE